MIQSVGMEWSFYLCDFYNIFSDDCHRFFRRPLVSEKAPGRTAWPNPSFITPKLLFFLYSRKTPPIFFRFIYNPVCARSEQPPTSPLVLHRFPSMNFSGKFRQCSKLNGLRTVLQNPKLSSCSPNDSGGILYLNSRGLERVGSPLWATPSGNPRLCSALKWIPEESLVSYGDRGLPLRLGLSALPRANPRLFK